VGPAFSTDVVRAAEFYSRLGFQETFRANQPHTPTKILRLRQHQEGRLPAEEVAAVTHGGRAAALAAARWAAVVVTVTLSGLGQPPATGALAADQGPAGLRLVATRTAVDLDRRVGPPGGATSYPALDLGVRVVPDRGAFELRISRDGYDQPIEAGQVTPGGTGAATPLPGGLLRDFAGLPRFFHITLTDGSGATVVDRWDTFCPNAAAVPVDSAAPASSPYPVTCSLNPFTLGGVWGIQAGWGASTVSQATPLVNLPDGRYAATVRVAARYRQLFGIPDQPQVIQVTARTVPGSPAATRLSTPAAAPRSDAGELPNLKAVPAWNFATSSSAGHDYLAFTADIWNAGPSRLDVRGVRRPGTGIMDAIQNRYDAQGHQAGSLPAGTMQWDPRPGHMHWHFTDFASYRLLNADQVAVVRSQKEAFCLANTDPIDLLVPGANWQPNGTDLHSACGDEQSTSVREVLEVGSGDTYTQTLPGQSFDITDLPGGTYYVEIIANPDGVLHETDTTDNIALRRVLLGGTPGARTIWAPPVGRVNAP
jgi:hypothetical protein